MAMAHEHMDSLRTWALLVEHFQPSNWPPTSISTTAGETLTRPWRVSKFEYVYLTNTKSLCFDVCTFK